MITIDQLQELTPSVFATSPSDKMSDKYVFVPTIKILENFQKEGWEISSATQVGKGVHSIHEIRLRNGGLPKVGDSVLESVIRNSHNGLARFSVSAGLHRFVCSNGLTIPTSVCESLDIKHQRFELDDVKELTESFATRLPVIQSSVSRMMNKELSTPEKMDFIKKAINIRWKTGSVPSTLDVMGMVSPRREEDRKNDLWTVFNVVQENMVRGGVKYQTKNGKPTETRGLKSILALNIVNTKLWELAETIS